MDEDDDATAAERLSEVETQMHRCANGLAAIAESLHIGNLIAMATAEEPHMLASAKQRLRDRLKAWDDGAEL